VNNQKINDITNYSTPKELELKSRLSDENVPSSSCDELK